MNGVERRGSREGRAWSQTATFFAPAQRAEPGALREMSRLARENPLVLALLDSVDGCLLILNQERQALAVNDEVFRTLGLSGPDCVLGARPGELLDCIRLAEAPGGCGTSQHCAECGAVLSVLASQRDGRPAVRECLLTTRRNGGTEAFEFRVRSTPLQVGPHALTAVVLQDISDEKRRKALEQVFFHDVLNTIGGLAGWSKLLGVLQGEKAKEAAQRIAALSERLTREVRDQRLLLQAERGELRPAPVPAWPGEVLETLRTVFSNHEAAEGKRLDLAEVSPEELITTDPSLLVRVLTNMVKNALEAVGRAESVRVWYERCEGRPTFRVWNPQAIPDGVARHIFQRSFSTKGQKGRGLGTYSMKLFGERYLGGEVSFSSTADEGTVFSIALPPSGPGSGS